ncbi:tRNA guanosine(34) transglycosylase Tgt [Candidatus Micrarchaeota archaeon]|nr:tRNA guanosine(34) transglycosylase Tgt [Candidatus Micrarchaeota archaeon]
MVKRFIPSFKVVNKSNTPENKSRYGILHLKHGRVETPAFAPVSTRGMIKLIDMDDLEDMNAQILMANTYHLFLRPGLDVIEESGGLNKYTSWKKPFMTDSGGFQAFSLGMGSLLGKSKFEYESHEQEASMIGHIKKHEGKVMARIDEDGIDFKSVYDGTKHRFTPEISIQAQEKLGADMIFAFDECTYPSASYEYTKESMERTHRWAERCLLASKRKNQMLFGIIQGGLYKDLRQASATYLSSLVVDDDSGEPKCFDGIGIGGAFGKDQMYNVLDWVIPFIPEDKPIHLLGIGTVKDIFESVKRGIDLFDCVSPQRVGRAGYFYVHPGHEGNIKNKFRLKITNNRFKHDTLPLDPECKCKMCKRYSRSFIHHIFKTEPLTGMRILSYHNLFFMLNLMKMIRESIKKDEFDELYDEWMS